MIYKTGGNLLKSYTDRDDFSCSSQIRSVVFLAIPVMTLRINVCFSLPPPPPLTQASCKVLSFLRLYSRSTTYVWMFCEGFYLHRLISNAFKPPKSLLFLYIAGWGKKSSYFFYYRSSFKLELYYVY